MAARSAVPRKPFCSLQDALRESSVGGRSATTPSEATSEEDYDDPISSGKYHHGRVKAHINMSLPRNVSNQKRDFSLDGSTLSETSSVDESSVEAVRRQDVDTHAPSAEARELRDIIRRGLERVRL